MQELSLRAPIGATYPAAGTDVLAIKTALASVGEYDPPQPEKLGTSPSEWTDDEMFTGLKRFQKKNELRVDGVAKPGGPTEVALNARLAQNMLAPRSTNAKSGTGFQTALQTPRKNFPTTRRPKKGTPAPVFVLRNGVGERQANESSDIQNTKKALAWANHYPVPKARPADSTPDEDLRWGIWRFQEAFSLKQDGILRPGGETERKLNALVAPLVQASAEPPGNEEDEPPVPDTNHERLCASYKANYERRRRQADAAEKEYQDLKQELEQLLRTRNETFENMKKILIEVVTTGLAGRILNLLKIGRHDDAASEIRSALEGGESAIELISNIMSDQENGRKLEVLNDELLVANEVWTQKAGMVRSILDQANKQKCYPNY